jgi:hypothetical protein
MEKGYGPKYYVKEEKRLLRNQAIYLGFDT